MEKLSSYIKLSRLELTKVIFPLKEQVKNAYLSVFLVVTIITLFLALIDSIMSFSLSGLY
jgi:preprotein translocase subunit SecE